VKILTVLGTRPQVVKAAPVAFALHGRGHEEIVLLTGQHYDADLLGETPPAKSLGIGSGSHAFQAAEGARGVAAFAAEVKPDCILAAGDTNSALAAGLGARIAGIPFVHGEAGVRLGDFSLPEEVNRVVLDHLADLCLCPTERAAAALRVEHPRARVVVAGDPLLDALPPHGPAPDAPSGPFLLATLHRAENTDDPARLLRILRALDGLLRPVLLPLHPRTRAAIARAHFEPTGLLRLLPPLGHAAVVNLARRASAVITDSGGLQREAYWLSVPCIVLREACEWRETVESGWAVLAGADPARIAAAAAVPPRGAGGPDIAAFGGGGAAVRWAEAVGRLQSRP
jgi:UDP-N-acetylglucosamine 2-epimerase